MKYLVIRTSGSYNENPKVKGVQKEMLPFAYSTWYGNRDGQEELKEAYTIELDTLESLQQFIKDCGYDIVVSNPYADGTGFQLPRIEIYDDYRE